MKINQHILKHSDGWANKEEGNIKTTVVFNKQEEAIEKGLSIDINHKSELLIHGKNWKMRKRNSYVKYPFPPKI